MQLIAANIDTAFLANSFNVVREMALTALAVAQAATLLTRERATTVSEAKRVTIHNL
ncbi:hypothetical protein RTM1035_14947 [Roseovarius sp. TM1035]|nr:Hypothetical protein RAK1035_0408 [Roseovarius sp. AK1035]EDM33292.1 hypothetical protein RTM1035_14947 [Roseovarius sp. TM1035]